MAKPKILIVDDDDATREVYTNVFKQSDYDVLEAHDGVEGLDIATKELPDVVFTGIVMPRMSGFELIEALNKSVVTSKIPVVISSHMGREEDQQKANVLGAKDFIMRDMVTPREAVERIGRLFIQEGEKYRLRVDASAFDAQKLVKEMSFKENLHCLECDNELVLDLSLKDPKNKLFEAKFICPNCGWEAK